MASESVHAGRAFYGCKFMSTAGGKEDHKRDRWHHGMKLHMHTHTLRRKLDVKDHWVSSKPQKRMGSPEFRSWEVPWDCVRPRGLSSRVLSALQE